MLAHERNAALRAIAKQRHARWSGKLRSDLEGRIAQLQREAETEEERRDVRRMWDLLNTICAKHARRSGAR
jgi:hypothetical protein